MTTISGTPLQLELTLDTHLTTKNSDYVYPIIGMRIIDSQHDRGTIIDRGNTFEVKWDDSKIDHSGYTILSELLEATTVYVAPDSTIFPDPPLPTEEVNERRTITKDDLINMIIQGIQYWPDGAETRGDLDNMAKKIIKEYLYGEETK